VQIHGALHLWDDTYLSPVDAIALHKNGQLKRAARESVSFERLHPPRIIRDILELKLH
jgi:hypothetical protein